MTTTEREIIEPSHDNAVIFAHLEKDSSTIHGFVVIEGNCEEVETIYNKHYKEEDDMKNLNQEQRRQIISDIKDEIKEAGYETSVDQQLTRKEWIEWAFGESPDDEDEEQDDD